MRGELFGVDCWLQSRGLALGNGGELEVQVGEVGCRDRQLRGLQCGSRLVGCGG